MRSGRESVRLCEHSCFVTEPVGLVEVALDDREGDVTGLPDVGLRRLTGRVGDVREFAQGCAKDG